jgi:anthranilate/para-aminobenzoate synthase component II
MNALIVDFGDSFTYNILNELLELNVQCNVATISTLSIGYALKFDLVILGPGPGVISDYEKYFSLIKNIVHQAESGSFKLLGICLGHQLVHNVYNRKVSRLNNPIHGQSVKVDFGEHKLLSKSLRNKSFDVQLYNSWTILTDTDSSTFPYELYNENNQLLASFSENITTYQFHPESIGTSCPKAFFKQVIR